MLTPANVFEEIKSRSERSDDPIRFYWIDVSSQREGVDRNRFVRLLHDRAAAYPVCAVILRAPGFMDANSVMNDLAEVLEDCKRDLLSKNMRDRIARAGHIDIALIARRELKLAVTSSPLVLPAWFPLRATEEVTARIEDLTWTTRVPLSAPEAHISDLQRLLYELDGVLLARLQAVSERDHDRRLQMTLLDRIRRKSETSLTTDALATVALTALETVRNPRHYRPRSTGPTPVSRLWRATIERPASGLQQLAKSLAQGLQVTPADADGHMESVVGVLARPTDPMDPAVRWTFNMIVTVGAACQLATAAAHADAYARYPVRLLGSLSRDLQRTLDDFIRVLEAGGDG